MSRTPWQLLAFLLYIVEVKVKLTRPLLKASRILPEDCFRNPRFFVYILPWMELNESKSGHSEAKCQLQAVRSFSNPTLNTLEVIRRFTWTFSLQS